MAETNGKYEVFRNRNVTNEEGDEVKVLEKVTKRVKIFQKNICGETLKLDETPADLTDVNVRLSL